MTDLSEHVRILGRGPGRSRSLTRDEARAAMAAMLDPACPPEAVGALLMLLRMKGETAEEIAGFAQAAQASIHVPGGAALDWPCYAAGRTRGLPWFLLSAALVAQAGHRVLLHGWNGPDRRIRDSLAAAGIAIASSASDVARLLDRDGIAYLPLDEAHPALFRLLDLRRVLGLRSCINTVCRMLDPGRARASVQGVFHPSYRLLQADAARLLGRSDLTVIKGGGGEFECHPAKEIQIFGLRGGEIWDSVLPARIDVTRRLAMPTDATLPQLWSGQAAPAFETAIVLATAETALSTLGCPDPAGTVAELWARQTSRHAA